MEVRRRKHHRIRGGVDEAEWRVGDDLVADLASAVLEMRPQQEGPNEHRRPLADPSSGQGLPKLGEPQGRRS